MASENLKGGREAEGDTKIYRHQAYWEHLREIACREDNSKIRKSSNNEQERVLAKRTERKEWKNNEKGHIDKSWNNFLPPHTQRHTHTSPCFFLVIMYSQWSVLAQKVLLTKRWMSMRVNHLRVLMSAYRQTWQTSCTSVFGCFAPSLMLCHHWPASMWDVVLQCVYCVYLL